MQSQQRNQIISGKNEAQTQHSSADPNEENTINNTRPVFIKKIGKSVLHYSTTEKNFSLLCAVKLNSRHIFINQKQTDEIPNILHYRFSFFSTLMKIDGMSSSKKQIFGITVRDVEQILARGVGGNSFEIFGGVPLETKREKIKEQAYGNRKFTLLFQNEEIREEWFSALKNNLFFFINQAFEQKILKKTYIIEKGSTPTHNAPKGNEFGKFSSTGELSSTNSYESNKESKPEETNINPNDFHSNPKKFFHNLKQSNSSSSIFKTGNEEDQDSKSNKTFYGQHQLVDIAIKLFKRKKHKSLQSRLPSPLFSSFEPRNFDFKNKEHKNLKMCGYISRKNGLFPNQQQQASKVLTPKPSFLWMCYFQILSEPNVNTGISPGNLLHTGFEIAFYESHFMEKVADVVSLRLTNDQRSPHPSSSGSGNEFQLSPANHNGSQQDLNNNSAVDQLGVKLRTFDDEGNELMFGLLNVRDNEPLEMFCVSDMGQKKMWIESFHELLELLSKKHSKSAKHAPNQLTSSNSSSNILNNNNKQKEEIKPEKEKPIKPQKEKEHKPEDDYSFEDGDDDQQTTENEDDREEEKQRKTQEEEEIDEELAEILGVVEGSEQTVVLHDKKRKKNNNNNDENSEKNKKNKKNISIDVENFEDDDDGGAGEEDEDEFASGTMVQKDDDGDDFEEPDFFGNGPKPLNIFQDNFWKDDSKKDLVKPPETKEEKLKEPNDLNVKPPENKEKEKDNKQVKDLQDKLKEKTNECERLKKRIAFLEKRVEELETNL